MITDKKKSSEIYPSVITFTPYVFTVIYILFKKKKYKFCTYQGEFVKIHFKKRTSLKKTLFQYYKKISC